MPEAFWIRGITEVEVKPDTDTSPRQDQRTQSSPPPPKVGMTPPAVRIKALVPAEGGDWGGGNPVALASSTYCRFTSARLAPGGSRNLFSPANPC